MNTKRRIKNIKKEIGRIKKLLVKTEENITNPISRFLKNKSHTKHHRTLNSLLDLLYSYERNHSYRNMSKFFEPYFNKISIGNGIYTKYVLKENTLDLIEEDLDEINKTL